MRIDSALRWTEKSNEKQDAYNVEYLNKILMV